MTRQFISAKSVKRACKWCAFVSLVKRTGKCSEFDLEWLAAKHDYSFAIARH